MNVMKSTRFGLLTGALMSVLATSVVTVWEWLENPGGIFHAPEGTNWNFVLETAISWLIPTFVLVTLVAFACHLVVSGIRYLATNRKSNAQGTEGDA